MAFPGVGYMGGEARYESSGVQGMPSSIDGPRKSVCGMSLSASVIAVDACLFPTSQRWEHDVESHHSTWSTLLPLDFGFLSNLSQIRKPLVSRRSVAARNSWATKP